MKKNCYATAARFVLDNEGWTLVHGSSGAWAERRNAGGTVEVKGIRSGMTTRYTRAETRERVLRWATWGPWLD